jgi:hypothetical protein
VGRFDTGRAIPPVRIGLAQARVQAKGLILDSLHTARGAGDYGMREARFASVPLRLRIDHAAGPNTPIGISGAIPIGHTRRKAGYPPLSDSTLYGTTG